MATTPIQTLPRSPDELCELRLVPVKVGGPSPWVRFVWAGHTGYEFMLSAGSFDLVRLAGKYLFREVFARARVVRGFDGRIEGGVLEDLDLVDEPAGPLGART